METILGLFARFEDAKRTVRNLREAGFSEEGLSIFSHEEILGEVEKYDILDNETPGSKKSVSGSARDLLGALAGLVISDQKVQIYTNGVRQGGALVIARATKRKANAVKIIMARFHALEVQHIFPCIIGITVTESDDLEPYYPLLWQQLQEA